MVMATKSAQLRGSNRTRLVPPKTAAKQHGRGKIQPSPVPAEPFTLEQELSVFGHWRSAPIWVPPQDSSRAMARSMLENSRFLESFDVKWKALTRRFRKQFTQVREIEIAQDSIRLPKGRLYVTVTEQAQFDTITDPIPACVQARLDEFLQGPGKRPGVRVYYLKPLCIEVDDQLIFTSADELHAAIKKIQREVTRHYHRLCLPHYLVKMLCHIVDGLTSLPRGGMKYFLERKKRAIDAYHAKLELERRKAVMKALRAREKCRSDTCTYEELLAVTNTPDRRDVVLQYAKEHQLNVQQYKDLTIAAGGVVLPWFVTLSAAASVAASVAAKISVLLAPPVLVCDPVFVAEMPGQLGTVMKIGHFDEVGGVMHVEI